MDLLRDLHEHGKVGQQDERAWVQRLDVVQNGLVQEARPEHQQAGFGQDAGVADQPRGQPEAVDGVVVVLHFVPGRFGLEEGPQAVQGREGVLRERGVLERRGAVRTH